MTINNKFTLLLLIVSGVLLLSGWSGDFLSLTHTLEKSSLPNYIKMAVLICATLVFIIGFLAIFTNFFNNISSPKCTNCGCICHEDDDDEDPEEDGQDADIKIKIN